MIKFFYIKTPPPKEINIRNRQLTGIIKGVALPYIFTTEYNLSENNYTIEIGEHGKPYIANAPFPIFFNISHTANLWACAVYDREIGMDVEKIGTPRLNVAERFFAKEEYNALLASEHQATDFAKLWTTKEAYGKLLGCGINSTILSSQLKAHKSTFVFDDAYICTICTEESHSKVQIIDLTSHLTIFP